MVGFIAVIIAILGWFTTYIFQVRSQNKNLINQLMNNARLEIVPNLRDYQNWLTKYQNYINILHGKLQIYANGGDLDWNQEVLTYVSITNARPLQWNVMLEENEILYKGIRAVRARLQWRDIRIGDFCLWFQNTFFSRDDIPLIVSNNRKEIVSRKMLVMNEIVGSMDYISNQICLVEDIRIYLHVTCLHKLTGNTIPERNPPVKSVPRIIKVNSQLKIINENDSIQLMNVIIDDFAPK